MLGTDAFVDRVHRGLVDLSGSRRRRRECGQAAALAAWLSLDDLIALVAGEYRVAKERLLRRHSRGNDARQVLLYLASRHCRGRHSLADLAERLGPITTGALTRARELMEARIARSRQLKRRIARLEKQIRGKGANCK